MSDGSKRGLRLTVKERQALGMAVEGKSVDAMATTLGQSVPTVRRYLEQGLTKLESWSRESLDKGHVPTLAEQNQGVLGKVEGLRQMTQRRRHQRGDWGCIVLVCFAKRMSAVSREPLNEQIARRIHESIRRTDIVSKWAPKEWVVFLSGVSEPDILPVVQRLQGDEGIPDLRIGFYLGTENDKIREGVEACHKELVAQYLREDLSAVWRVGS